MHKIISILFISLSFAKCCYADMRDSFVESLSCSHLDKSSIYSSLQATAFSTDKEWPVSNWSTPPLANCWALALSQREIFYLSRFGATNSADFHASGNLDYLLDLISGSKLENKIIPLSDPALSLFSDTIISLRQGIGGKNFKSSIENRQRARFYSLDNLEMIFGDRDRGAATNSKTMSDILQGVSHGRLPLLILRAKTTMQHAVLVRSIEILGNQQYTLHVYDSNQPQEDAQISYKDNAFYAPDILNLLAADSKTPVGVFLKDEDKMDRIQNIVLNYYQKLCSPAASLSIPNLGDTYTAPNTATDFFQSGLRYFQNGENNNAIAQFQSALQLNPAFEEAHLQLAISNFFKGENTLALEELGKIKITPELMRVTPLLKAHIFMQDKNWEGALQLWQSFPASNADLQALKAHGIAQAMEELSQPQAAAEAWQSYLELQSVPTNSVFAQIAKNRIAAKQIQEGIAYCENSPRLARESYRELCKAHIYRAANKESEMQSSIAKALLDKKNLEAQNF